MNRILKAAPNPLKLQVITRLCLLVLTAMLIFALTLLVDDIVIISAGLCILACIAISLISLLNIIKRQEYLVIEGICTDYTTAGLRKRVKKIIMSTPDGIVEVRPREGIKTRKDGTVRIYLRKNARIYLENDKRIVLDYLAIETNI